MKLHRHHAAKLGLLVVAVALLVMGLSSAHVPDRRPAGDRHVLAPTGQHRGLVRFDLAALRGAVIHSAWLRHDGERRQLALRRMRAAARRGVLQVRVPSRWRASWRQTRAVVYSSPPAVSDVSCGLGSFRAGKWPGGCWRPYGSASPFNRPLPATPRVAEGSARIVARLLSFGAPAKLVAGDADTPDDYGHPTYYAQPGDPVFRVHCYQSSWGQCSIEGTAIHVPDAARPAGGADAHMTVVDQASGWEYDLYKVRSKPPGGGTLEVRWGGRTAIAGDGLGSDATAARFGNLAGIIRAAELSAGHIDHALFMVALCDAGSYVYPAQKSGRSCAADGLPTSGAPPMGTRLQLAMTTAQIDRLAVPQWKKTILRAMARYGLILGDTGGSGFGIQTESGSTYTSFGVPDPLVAFARANGWTRDDGRYVADLASGVDWARYLRVIDPCVSQPTC